MLDAHLGEPCHPRQRGRTLRSVQPLGEQGRTSWPWGKTARRLGPAPMGSCIGRAVARATCRSTTTDRRQAPGTPRVSGTSIVDQSAASSAIRSSGAGRQPTMQIGLLRLPMSPTMEKTGSALHTSPRRQTHRTHATDTLFCGEEASRIDAPLTSYLNAGKKRAASRTSNVARYLRQDSNDSD